MPAMPLLDGRDLRTPLLAFVSTRAALLVVVYVGLVLVAVSGKHAGGPVFPGVRVLDGWERWDSYSYWLIARDGWGDGGHSPTVNYFPFYSWLCGALSWPARRFMGGEQAFSLVGLSVSYASFLAALVGLHRLTRAISDEATAGRAVWLVAAFPYAFFASAVYTESFYLACCVWAFDCARRDRWAGASVLAAAAGATRIVGFIVAGALVVEHLRVRGLRGLRRDSCWLLVAPLGTLFVLGWAWWRFGDPLLSFEVQVLLHSRSVGLGQIPFAIQVISDHEGVARAADVLQLALIPVAAVLGVVAWRRFGAGMAVYALGSLAVCAASGLPGMGRYIFVMFPLFMAAAAWWRMPRWAFVASCAVSFALQLWFADGFAHWEFIT
jgi:hypothetical protein